MLRRQEGVSGVVVKIQERIGICKVDGDGTIIELQREFFGQGWVYKDWEAFRNHPDAPCYVPELDDVFYTRNDFMAMCNGQEEIAEELFDAVDWQNPSTLMNDWENAGEIATCRKCGKLFMAYHIKKCPHCGSDVGFRMNRGEGA